MISRTNAVLAGTLAIVMLLATWTRVDYSRPNYEILPDMKYTSAWTAFSANPNFNNRRTLQSPAPGTIARGHLPLHYGATQEDAVRAGEELQNPYHAAAITDTMATGGRVDDAAGGPPPAGTGPEDRLAELRQRELLSVQRGANVYRVFCTPCHGPLGAGDGLVAARGFPPPPSLLTGKSLQMKDGQLFHILTYGQANMSAFAGQLSPEKRWDVINYVRSLQQAASPADTGATEGPAAVNTQDVAPEQDTQSQSNTQGTDHGDG